MEKKHSTVTLIPGGCPQFLDYTLHKSDLPRLIRSFKEERKEAQSTAGRYDHHLRCLERDETGFVDQLTYEPCEPDYSINIQNVIDVWKNAWIPIPILRTREQKWQDGGERFECGPSNWSRARVVEDETGTIKITLMFDTIVEPHPQEGEFYHALSPEDVSAHGHFALAHHVRDNAWFLNAVWVDEWLANIYDTYRSSIFQGRGSWKDNNENVLEHLAAYLTWLELIRVALHNTSIHVINPEREQPVEVDLILDIGNSRTTGILVETISQKPTSLNDSYLLELRDISAPENIYSDPFETRVEFVQASFGNDALSRRSGRRKPAFAWPSAVRVGPEAARLATRAVCAEGVTGMSSPKRYLWDERTRKQSWRFNTGGTKEPMVASGLFAKQVNTEGTPLICFDDVRFRRSKNLRTQKKEPAFESFFTRSSLMLFMMGEIITHALVTINAPATRARRELPNIPRRLRRILFTVPTAMPVAEKEIFRRWVSWAVRVVWEALDWSEWYVDREKTPHPPSSNYRISPQVRCDWDEASCSQIVFIYNELSVKYHGDAHHLFTLLGKPRAKYDNKPCMRIASIDTGGGTMDLSIVSFELASSEGDTARIIPHMEFRDGFNSAGDEVLREIVSMQVIPNLIEAFRKVGIADSRALVGQLFGRDISGDSQERRNLRARLVRQVTVPIALGMLGLCEMLYQRSIEAKAIQKPYTSFTCRLRDFFKKPPHTKNVPNTQESDTEHPTEPFAFLEGIDIPAHFYHPHPQPHIIKAVEDVVRAYIPQSAASEDFSLMDVELRINPSAVEQIICTTLGQHLADLCEVVNLLDCDILLLTGRPSAWSGIVAPVLAKLPVPPDRIIPMRQYHVGSWYPFADAHGRITDPKTTVVVGAILCALAEGHLEGFSFDANKLQLESIARYVGELDLSGQLRNAKIWFEVDVKSTKNEPIPPRKVAFSTHLPIGYRQANAERWPTTRYHIIDFSSEDARARASGRLPYTLGVTLSTSNHTQDESIEKDEGEFDIEYIVDDKGNDVNIKDVVIRLQTMKRDEGYWMDTGIVKDA